MRIISLLRSFTRRESCRAVRIVFIALLPLFLSGWTCTAIVSWNSCPDSVQIISLSPHTISANAQLVVLTVNGNNFDPPSRILWNGNPLQTNFIDSHHLQTTITWQMLELLGASAGVNVLISVESHQFEGCWNGMPGTFILIID